MKKIGPMIGICASTGMENLGSRETVPALLRPSPSTRLMPVPRKVSASPLTTWSAWRVMVIKAWIWLIKPAASIATSTPSQGLPVAIATLKALIAPISIMPSTPRFSTPERSANISPIVAKSKHRAGGDACLKDDDEIHGLGLLSVRTMRNAVAQ